MSADFNVFADFGTIDAAANSILLAVMIFYFVACGIALLVAAAMYVFQALGLYTIAKRRGIHHPGLAWVPVANMWILGSISDQYQYVVKGRIRSRRKVLLGLLISVYALLVVCMVLFIVSIASAVMSGPISATASDAVPVLGALGLYLVAWVLSMIALVFMYIAYYDLFASCNPSNAVLFLVLSIFFNFLLPFFVFACRKKDEGMPPRKVQVPAEPSVDTEEPVLELQPAEESEAVVVEEEPVCEAADTVASEEDFEA